MFRDFISAVMFQYDDLQGLLSLVTAVCVIILVPPSSSEQTIILKTRLEAAYKALSVSDGRTFAQAEREVEREAQMSKESLFLNPSLAAKESTSPDSEQNQLFQRDSGSPIEASPADQPPHTDTVPQTQGSLSKTPEVRRNGRLPKALACFVIEPDSQGGSQSTTISQEMQVESVSEEPAKASKKSHKR